MKKFKIEFNVSEELFRNAPKFLRDNNTTNRDDVLLKFVEMADNKFVRRISSIDSTTLNGDSVKLEKYAEFHR